MEFILLLLGAWPILFMIYYFMTASKSEMQSRGPLHYDEEVAKASKKLGDHIDRKIRQGKIK